MTKKSMTALISAYSRAYHSENNQVKIFDDYLAKKILSNKEYTDISMNMTKGISYFNPGFTGNEEKALRWIVDNQLSPTPLGRAAFCEKKLTDAARTGVRQYVILGAGYDTFAFRQPEWAKSMEIFEIDSTEMSTDKKQRLKNAHIVIPDNLHFLASDFNNFNWISALTDNIVYNFDVTTFCSLLGLSYYLSEQSFTVTLECLHKAMPSGSIIVFDYPDEYSYTDKAGERAKKQAMLAKGANEEMLAGYSYEKTRLILENCGFFIHEHLTPEEITEQYFKEYNHANPEHTMSAFDNVNYCLAVKK